MTSAIARTVQAVSKEELANLQGLGGLDRLCRVFGSADYVERALRDWSDDVVRSSLLVPREVLTRRCSSSLSSGKSFSIEPAVALGPVSPDT